jgi:hypothetical protein
MSPTNEASVSDRYMLGAYWGARRESVEQCAGRLSAFLTDLAACDPALGRWYERASSFRQALARPVSPDSAGNLVQVLDRGRNRTNVGRAVIEDLGFQIGLWNGQEAQKGSGLSIRCGLYWKSSTPGVSIGNCVVLDLPEDLGQLRTETRMTQALTATVSAWKPDWAGVMSRAAMNARGFDANVPFVDWMVFLPRRVERLSPPSSVEELQGGTSIIVVQPTPPSEDSAEDLGVVSRVRKAILAAF